jgi:hypothetical protein
LEVAFTVAEVQTKIATVEKRGEWFRIETEPTGGNQYGMKLDTKRGEVAFLAQQLIGQPVVVEYTERTSDRINQHTGRPFTNRYLESVAAAGAAPAAGVPSAAQTFTPAASSSSTASGFSDDRGAKAGRNNIAAAAVEALIQLSDGNPETVQRLLDGLARWSESGEPIFTTPPVSQPAATPPVDDFPF